MKKVLIISDTPTHPTETGNKMCILSYATLLKDMGYDVYFLYFTRNINGNVFLQNKEYWKDHFLYFQMSIIQKTVIKIAKYLPFKYSSHIWLHEPWFIKSYIEKIQRRYKFDSIILNYIWFSKIANYFKGNTVLFTHDVFSYRNLRLKGNYWVSCTPNVEAKCINRVDSVLAIQEQEAHYYKYLSYKTNIYCMYSPFSFHKQEIINNKKLLFFAGNNILNIEGINFFIKNIFPEIINNFPDIQLIIGGEICNHLEKELDNPYISLKGKFENPADFYALGDIVINPVFNGTGLKIKTFEALSYGKTVLSSTHSMEGIFSPQICPVYTADTANDYITHLKNIFLSPQTLIENKNLAEKYIDALDTHIKNILSKIL